MNLLNCLNGTTPLPREIADRRPHASLVRQCYDSAFRVARVQRALVILDITDVPATPADVKRIAKQVPEKLNVRWARDELIAYIQWNKEQVEQRSAADKLAAVATGSEHQPAATAAVIDGPALMMDRVEPTTDTMMAPVVLKKKIGQHCEVCAKSWKEVHGATVRSNVKPVLCGRQRFVDLQHLQGKPYDPNLVEDCEKFVGQTVDIQARKISEDERVYVTVKVKMGCRGRPAAAWICPDCFVQGVDTWSAAQMETEEIE
eukprot:COSAG01_NODE_9776_length_2347_cov_2.181940_3_plen_260_part_00